MKVNLVPELVQLIRQKAQRQYFRREVARCIVEQAVMQLAPELNFIVESEESLTEIDTLVQHLSVNDIVINGRHIDVTVLEDSGNVEISAAVLETPYIECGSLVVQLTDTESGAVIGHITNNEWRSAAQSGDKMILKFHQINDFDLAECLKQIERLHSVNVNRSVSVLLRGEEYLKFITTPDECSLDLKRQIVAAAISTHTIRENLNVLSTLSNDETPRILNNSRIWESRVNRIVTLLSSKFSSLPLDRINFHVRATGELFGGQPDAPGFKAALAQALANEKLSTTVATEALPRFSKMVELVASGKSVFEAASKFIKSQVSLEIASVISEQRRNLGNFADATKDEITFAFQKLALQPAYATHSKSEESGTEAINDALQLLETGKLVEEIKSLDF